MFFSCNQQKRQSHSASVNADPELVLRFWSDCRKRDLLSSIDRKTAIYGSLYFTYSILTAHVHYQLSQLHVAKLQRQI